jgi:putative transposase
MARSCNSKVREECLSMEWFENRIDAKIVLEKFRRQYYEVRRKRVYRVLNLKF